MANLHSIRDFSNSLHQHQLKGMTDVSAFQCDTVTVDGREGREASSLIGSAAFQFQGPSV